MQKKILYIILVALIVQTTSVGAANTESRFDMLAYLDIMVGYDDGDLGLDRLVTRAEFSKMAIEASNMRNSVAAKLKISPFEDVTYDKWYAPYVYLGAVNNIFAGYIDGSFRPENNVTYEEAVMVALRLFGYSDDEFRYSWPYGPVSAGEKNGLCDGMHAFVGQALTRDQVSHLFYNLLNANNGVKYITNLGYLIEEDVVLAASYNETAALNRGKVYTSKGMLDVSDDFDYSNIGLKGDAVIKDGKITAFFPYSEQSARYNVFDVTGSNIILYKDGQISDYNLQGSETVYYNLQALTVDTITPMLSTGDTLDFYFNSSGALDYIVYSESELDGPFVVKNSTWTSAYGIPENASVMRSGIKANISEVNVNDIIYYSKNLNTVWVYNDTFTGVYESAQPNKNTPTTVTVSGKTYTIESAEAYNALSSNGTFAYGDTVKLLLGKDGQIAGVVSPYSSDEEYIGYVISSGSRKYTSQNGTNYTSNYINIALCDGSVFEYETDRSVSDNQAVRLIFKNGKAVANSLPVTKSVSGKFDYMTLTLGDSKVSRDAEILEVIPKNGTDAILYGRVYPQRLDGVDIYSKSVIYTEKDSNGTIIKMILCDITGDLYSYGIVTKASTVSAFTSGSYTYFDGATLKSTVTQGSSFSVYAGNPIKIKVGANAVPDSISQLNKVGAVTKISDAYINNEYKLYSGVIVYENTYDYEYQVIDIDTIRNNLDRYYVTAYSDKPDLSGGRIRVLIAKKK